MAKLVYIHGAHGVGKSTLQKDTIYSSSRKIECFSEVARQLIISGVGHGLSAPKEDYFAYISKHIENFNLHLQNIEKFDVFLGDRSIIDVLVYTRICHGRDSNYIERLCQAFFQTIRYHIAFLVYIPIEFMLRSDGVRDESIDHQMEYDSELRIVLSELGCTVYTVGGDRLKRVNILNELIKLHCS